MPDWLKPLKDLGSGILSYFWDEDDGIKYENIIPLLTAYGVSRVEDSDKLSSFFGLDTPMPTGYMGGIPDYTYKRNLVPNAFTNYERDNAGLMTLDAEEANIPRRPGGAGRRYFTDGIFSPTVAAEEAGDSVCPPGSLRAGETIPAGSTESYCSQIHTSTDLCANPTYAAANPTICTAIDTAESTTTGYTAAQIAAYVTYLQNLYGGGSGTDTAEMGGGQEGDLDFLGNTAGAGTTLAGGGLATLKPRGYYLGGRTDGMADRVPATIDQREPARLSDGEFVVPADVVSHLGNGSSNAGADQLFSMMDRVRKARTGRKSQGKKITPQRYLG